MRGFTAARGVALLAALLAAPAGCGSELEVKGKLDRVIGETITLRAAEGDVAFSGNVALEDAEGETFASGLLRVTRTGDSKLSFVLPPGMATGKATALAGKKGGGEDDAWTIPLRVSRLALAVNAQGVVEVLPLGRSTLEPSTLSGVNAAGGLVSLSPGGGKLAVLAQGELDLLALGESPSNAFPGLKQGGAKAMVAIPDGVLLCTANELLLYRAAGTGTTKLSKSYSEGCQALATSATGTRAAVLLRCDPDQDTVEENCIHVVSIGAKMTLDLGPGKPFGLGGPGTATRIGMTADGKGVVVPDADAVHGVWLDSSPYSASSKKWSTTAKIVDMARGVSSLGDQFAVAEAMTKTVYFFSFNTNKTPAPLETPTADPVALVARPTALSYGRDATVYVATGTQLYRINANVNDTKAEVLSLSAASSVATLLVQP